MVNFFEIVLTKVIKKSTISIVRKNKRGCGGIGRRAGLRNQFFGVQVQLLLPAPLKNLVELWFNLLININSRNGIDFLLCKRKE